METLLYKKDGAQLTEGLLTYSPFYRFVTEPFVFNIEKNVPAYVSNALGYMLRTKDVKNVIRENDSGYFEVIIEDSDCSLKKISVIGNNRLDRLELQGQNSLSILDLSEKKICISSEHSKVCFAALFKSNSSDLKNLSLAKSEERIEISYDG